MNTYDICIIGGGASGENGDPQTLGHGALDRLGVVHLGGDLQPFGRDPDLLEEPLELAAGS